MPSKRDKFVKLAEKRVSNALNNLRLIGNLANKTSYAYDQQDIDKIFRALNKGVGEAKSKFSSDGQNTGSTFRLESRPRSGTEE